MSRETNVNTITNFYRKNVRTYSSMPTTQLTGIHGVERLLVKRWQKINFYMMMLLSSGLLAYLIIWMGNQSKGISSTIKDKVKSNTSIFGLLLISFLSVFREGLELSISTMTKVSERASNVALGSVLGIILSIVLTYIIFKSSVKFNLKLVFKILGLILIYIGAEMFAEGVLKLIAMDNEMIEVALKSVFILPSLYLFLKDDVKN